MNSFGPFCIDALGKNTAVPIKVYQCHGQGGNQVEILCKSNFNLLDTVLEF